MKLSQAIRRGCRQTHQIKAQFTDGEGGACAFGAAMIGVNSDSPHSVRFEQEWPILDNPVRHPITLEKTVVYDVIVSLNDKYDWTREAIADWVESVELGTMTMQPIVEEKEVCLI